MEVDGFVTLQAVLNPVRLSRYVYPDGTSTGSAVVRVNSKHKSTKIPNLNGCLGCPYYATCADRGNPQDRDYYLENTRRARQQIQRYVRANDLRRLLTFTNGGDGEGFASRQETLDSFARWLKVHAALLGDTPIAVVAERGGARGRWHIHAVIRSGYRLDYNRIRKSWSAFLSKRGFISPTGLHRFHAGDDSGKHSRGFQSSRIAALYVAKYIGKHVDDDDRSENAHRYRTYNGQTPTPEITRHGSLQAAADSLGAVGWYHALHYVDGVTGELRQFGFLFDTSRALGGEPHAP